MATWHAKRLRSVRNVFAFQSVRPKPTRTTKGKKMADSPLPGLLDRAYNVFSLAGKLGRAFHEEHQGRQGLQVDPAGWQGLQVDPAGWRRHAVTFKKFCEGLLELRDAMQNPPDDFEPVAAQLLEAARIARAIRHVMQHPDGRTWATYLEFFPELNSVFDDGSQAVLKVTRAHGLDDPFFFLDAAETNGVADQAEPADTAAEPESEPVPDSQSSKTSSPTKSMGGWMGDMELANALGVHPSQIQAFRAKLSRMRNKHELLMDDWQESPNPKRNEPQFLYRANAPAIVAMAKRYSLPK